MLNWALTFFIIAIIAAVFGFGEVDPIGWTKFRPFLDGVAG